MSEIAQAAGISRKSLFLYFPSKSDLIWHRSGPFIVNLDHELQRADGDAVAAIVDAIIAGFAARGPDEDTLRVQTRLYSGDADVRELVEARGMGWRSIVETHLVDHGFSPRDAELIAFGFWRALWRGLEGWANGDAGREEILREELESMRVVARRLRG